MNKKVIALFAGLLIGLMIIVAMVLLVITQSAETTQPLTSETAEGVYADDFPDRGSPPSTTTPPEPIQPSTVFSSSSKDALKAIDALVLRDIQRKDILRLLDDAQIMPAGAQAATTTYLVNQTDEYIIYGYKNAQHDVHLEITLNKTPVDEMQEQAELYLAQQLEIERDDFCGYPFLFKTHESVTENLTGIVDFSKCTSR